jgi:hypothetical protein
MQFQKAKDEFRSKRANKAASGILSAMETGCFFPRSFFVHRFQEAGYCERLAALKADAFIAINTDIEHWSRFVCRNHPEGVAYGFQQTFTA